MTLTLHSSAVTRRRQILIALLVGPMVVAASCASQSSYRNVRVVQWTATTVPLASEGGAEDCAQTCEAARFRSDNGPTTARRLFPSPPPHSDEDCRRRIPDSRYDANSGGCVVGFDTQAYVDCLAACPSAQITPGRCDPDTDAVEERCFEGSVVVEEAVRQPGTCQQWHRYGTEEAPGEEVSCEDHVVTRARASSAAVGAVVGIIIIVGLLVGMTVAFSQIEISM